ncbi:MAG: metal ABC transporter ATP-binding protein [Geodermatophilaceae bacterium]|nr:metal ABC transporter ATP-binding protein [Geodermatophilaceae bacterium]
MNTVVDVARVSVTLDGRSILDDVSLRLATGEAVSLLGANGSGKSTLVRAIVGLVPLRAGSVSLFGAPLPRFRQWQRIGYVPQRVTAASGVPATVREVVAAGRLSHHRPFGRFGRADRAAIDAALETVGLAPLREASVARLSGGQQQRVLIARALAGRPDLLILDEPMSGLDDATQQATTEALRDLVTGGTSLLLVLHDLGYLDELIDRCVVLHGGRAAEATGRHESSAEHPHETVAPPHESVSLPATSFGLTSSPLDVQARR